MSRFTVGDVMTKDVVSVREDAPFHEIVDIIENRGFSAVPVVDSCDRVVGVVSEADLLPKIEFAGGAEPARLLESRRHRVARHKAAGEVARGLMSSPAETVLASAPVVNAARLMESAGVKQLPVTSDLGRLVGIVTRGDLLKVFVRSDADIRDDVLAEVLRHVPGAEPTHVQVRVENGTVTLTGELERRTLVPLAVRLAERVDGVVAVIDGLTYKEDDNVGLTTAYPFIRM